MRVIFNLGAYLSERKEQAERLRASHRMMLERALAVWDETREQTLDLLDMLSDEQLSTLYPLSAFSSFANLFQYLGSVQQLFARAVQTGCMSYSELVGERNIAMLVSKAEIVAFLHEVNTEFVNLVKRAEPQKEVNWHATSSPLLGEHVYRLVQHEAMHQGQIVAYYHCFGIDLPPASAHAKSVIGQ